MIFKLLIFCLVCPLKVSQTMLKENGTTSEVFKNGNSSGDVNNCSPKVLVCSSCELKAIRPELNNSQYTEKKRESGYEYNCSIPVFSSGDNCTIKLSDCNLSFTMYGKSVSGKNESHTSTGYVSWKSVVWCFVVDVFVAFAIVCVAIKMSRPKTVSNSHSCRLQTKKRNKSEQVQSVQVLPVINPW